MNNGKKLVGVLLAGALSFGLLACKERQGKEEKKAEKKAEEQAVVEGLVMTFGEDGIIYADPETDTLFYARIPEEALYDKNGTRIPIEELQDGDRIAFYGSEIVLQSYPPQYAQITKAVRKNKGTKEDIAPYEELLAQIYTEPDPMEVPYMDIHYRTKDAVVTSVTEQLGYQWTGTNEDGIEETIQACALPVLEVQGMEAQKLDGETTELTLLFSKSPKEVKVTRWEKGTKPEDSHTGESVDVTLEKRKAVIKEPKTASVYQVEAFWEQGNVTYGFAVE